MWVRSSNRCVLLRVLPRLLRSGLGCGAQRVLFLLFRVTFVFWVFLAEQGAGSCFACGMEKYVNHVTAWHPRLEPRVVMQHGSLYIYLPLVFFGTGARVVSEREQPGSHFVLE
jgi:hypothetical protein